jgi:hypothetical protein
MKRAVFLLCIATLVLLLTQRVSGKGLDEAAAAGNAPASALELDMSSADWLNLKLAPDLQATLEQAAPDQMLRVIVTMRERANLASIQTQNRNERLTQVVELLQSKAAVSQQPLLAFLEHQRREGSVGEVISFWVFNGLTVEAMPAVITELAGRPDILRITADEVIEFAPDENPENPVEANIEHVNAPALWALGIRGQGVVVANLDTGVSVSHPDLAAQWRGGTNSWYDPYGENPSEPVDFNGHGTRTMGVMVGRDASGSAIGIAPEAQWIAVKIFNNQGSATTTGIHLGYQWLLDPDGNPATADAPHVVNSSWGYAYPGCNLEFQFDLQALRAAGILPVFSAGNAGPGSSTSVSPANYPEAFAVGAVDNFDQIYPLSSRGPSACGEPVTTFPELVAPGVNILSSDLYGTYFASSGTSLAAPHVTGGLALLLSAFQTLSVSEQADAIMLSALDLGLPGPDNDFGYGRLDIYAAYLYILANGGIPSTPMPTPTPSFTPDPPSPTPTLPPTATSTPQPSPTPTATPESLINLALNRTVSVSSTFDSAHSGSKAVDGSMQTSWQTKRKSKLATEWLQVDLGSLYTISEIHLLWDIYYPTRYDLQISADQLTWITVYSTTAGSGGNESVTFDPLVARYIKMISYAWSDGNLRCGLFEFEVMGLPDGMEPTPTATLSPTWTPTPGADIPIHVGDLDGSGTAGANNRWNAEVTIRVHDAAELPVSGAVVSGAWSGGVSGSASCQTDSAGLCAVMFGNIRGNLNSVAFTVTSLSFGSAPYDSSANHDPDGDTNGTTITVLRP